MTTQPKIERAFLTLPGRQVHYRRAGSGPPVVLLHQSPKSSEELVPLMLMLAEDFTVLAPDTPGYGLSDPIVSPDADIKIDVFADAVAEFLDGMGIARTGLYGLHTGAAIATRFTARYPDRVLALVANGTLIKTPEERADYLAHYLPRFVPSWDGGHLAWAWSRMREQMIYFPWHKRDPVARVAIPMTLDGLQINTLALMEAGDHYRTAYRTAFAYAAEDDIARISVPTRYLCAESDVLYLYLDRFPPLPSNAAIGRVSGPQQALDLAQDFFRDNVTGEAPPTVPTVDRPRRLSSSIQQIASGQIHVRSNRDGDGHPVVVLHDVGGSSRGLDALLGGLIGLRPVFAPDLPGHGYSDPAQAGEGPLIDRLAKAIGELISALELKSVDLIAVGDSAAIALALAATNSSLVANLTLCNISFVPADRVAEFERESTPSLAPNWGGGHLLTAWHWARDQDMFWPWFDKSAAAALEQGLPAHEPIVQQRVIDLFKAAEIHSELRHEIIHDRLAERIDHCPVPLNLFVSPDRAGRRPDATLRQRQLPLQIANWARTILGDRL